MIGTRTANLEDGSNSGTTADDNFFGVINPGGVSTIQLTNQSGGIEIDHLHYGVAGTELPVTILVDAPGQGCINLPRSFVSVIVFGTSNLDVRRIDLHEGTWSGDNGTGTLTGDLQTGVSIMGMTPICTTH